MNQKKKRLTNAEIDRLLYRALGDGTLVTQEAQRFLAMDTGKLPPISEAEGIRLQKIMNRYFGTPPAPYAADKTP